MVHRPNSGANYQHVVSCICCGEREKDCKTEGQQGMKAVVYHALKGCF